MVPVAVVAITLAALVVSDARGEVFHSRESALRLAFPEADTVLTETLVLDEAQTTRIQRLAGAKMPSQVVRVYVGRRDGRVEGFAFIETHRVRSLPETVMVVVGPDGTIRGTHLLAFHEPPEYLPSDPWLGQFEGRSLDPELAVGRGVAGIAGSTLTAQAVTACVRRAAAVAETCLIPEVAQRTAASDSGTR